MKIEKVDRKKHPLHVLMAGFAMVSAALALIGFCLGLAHGADVLWSRLKGKVKAVNYKTAALTIVNPEGDLLTLKVDDDVTIMEGKETKALKDVALDDKVVLVNAPKAPKAKDSDEPPAGGVYK